MSWSARRVAATFSPPGRAKLGTDHLRIHSELVGRISATNLALSRQWDQSCRTIDCQIRTSALNGRTFSARIMLVSGFLLWLQMPLDGPKIEPQVRIQVWMPSYWPTSVPGESPTRSATISPATTSTSWLMETWPSCNRWLIPWCSLYLELATASVPTWTCNNKRQTHHQHQSHPN